MEYKIIKNDTDYNLDYRDSFTHTLHYSKYHYPMPQNPFSLKMETYLDPYKAYSEAEAKELAEKIYNGLMSLKPILFDQNIDRSTKYRKFITLTKEPRTRENLAERIHKELEPHYGTVFLDESFYPSVEPLDETKCTISITPDVQIKVSVTSEEYPRSEHTIRHGVHIQFCEYDENSHELVKYVGVKYSTEQTIESPLILHATIQELLERIKRAKN